MQTLLRGLSAFYSMKSRYSVTTDMLYLVLKKIRNMMQVFMSCSLGYFGHNGSSQCSNDGAYLFLVFYTARRQDSNMNE